MTETITIDLFLNRVCRVKAIEPNTLRKLVEQPPEYSRQQRYIDSVDSLRQLCEDIRGQRYIAVDTEFMREKTYSAEFCLLQLATENIIACVDPVAIGDLSLLWEVFYRDDVTLVIHAARQDVEILLDKVGDVPKHIFDTQIAATLVGYGEQIGYANLVKALFNVSLSKSNARTDWLQRPLTSDQIEYAMDDVRYLLQIYHMLTRQLQSQNRLDWLNDDFAMLSSIDLYQTNVETCWQRIRGGNRLRGVQLAVLQALARWREQKAQALNRPRRWILNDEVLVELARRMPVNTEQFASHSVLQQIKAKYTDELITQIQQAKSLPQSQWPVIPTYAPLSLSQEAQADVCMAIVKHCALQNNVAVSMLATRKDVESFVQGNKECAILSGWRYRLVGKLLLAFCSGNFKLGLQNGQLIFDE